MTPKFVQWTDTALVLDLPVTGPDGMTNLRRVEVPKSLLVQAFKVFPEGVKFFLNEVAGVLRGKMQMPSSQDLLRLRGLGKLPTLPEVSSAVAVDDILGPQLLELERALQPPVKIKCYMLPVGPQASE